MHSTGPWRTPILVAMLVRGAFAGAGGNAVPMDSWMYPALDRLAAMGFISSQIAGVRPWTRRECMRQLREADAALGPREDAAAAVAADIVAALHRELDGDESDPPLVLESVYARGGAIAGDFLNDSFHFGQTWRNDLGRPFGRGINTIAGFTARAEKGRYFGWIRAEHQQAPGLDAYPAQLGLALAIVDRIPEPPARNLADVNRIRIVEGYAGARLGTVRISVGKQALFWGPGEQAPLSFSSNAEPTANLRISSDQYRVGRLGVARVEVVFGKLGGHRFTSSPWFNAQKVSFKLSDDLEMGFTRWSLFFGQGHPMTVGAFFRNFFSFSSPDSPTRFDRADPGDRKGGFDFRWRAPGGLRDWLTLYSDSYSDDDPSPLAAPRRAGVSPGVWLNRIPWIPNLDLRVEAASTTPLGSVQDGGRFNYYNAQYRGGNTNYGYLLGNPVGRDGRAIEAKSNYRLSPRDRIEVSFRQQKISGRFLAGGGTQTSGSIASAFRIRESLYASTNTQYERLRIPMLTGGPGSRHNWSGWLQLTWQPDRGLFERLKKDRK
jgi:hypothetical protein